MNKNINLNLAIGIIIVIVIAFSSFLFLANKQGKKLSSQPKKIEITPEAKKTAETKNTPNQKKNAFIKAIDLKDGKYFLTADSYNWLSGAEAEKAMREDGVCSKNPNEECIVYNDYYIRNKDIKTETLEISPEVSLLMQTWTIGQEGGDIQWDQPVEFSEFIKVFDPKSESRLKDVPYVIELNSDNAVVKIIEQYIS